MVSKTKLKEVTHHDQLLEQQERLNKFAADKKFERDTIKADEINQVYNFKSLVQKYESNLLCDIVDWKPKTKSKDSTKILNELVRISFNKYPVPKFFYDAWIDNESKSKNFVQRYTNAGTKLTDLYNIAPVDFCEWYICVAQGGSLYKKHAKEFMTKMEVHNFLNCPYKDLSLGEALWYSIAFTEGKDVGSAINIARSKLNKRSIIDPFLQYIARFFANYKVNTKDINDCIDFIDYHKREHPEFSLKGYTLESLKARVKIWHAELNRMKSIGGGSWNGIDICNSTIIRGSGDKKIEWKFTQILTGNDLAKEGSAMRHCVASYKSFCMTGKTAIWSLTSAIGFEPFKRNLTIEVSIPDSRIVQARGLANRNPKGDEENILREWGNKNGISTSRY